MGRAGHYDFMDTTISPFTITFAGRSVIAEGGHMLDTLPEHAMPVTYATSATPLIGRQHPRLDDWGHVQASFEVTAVFECASHFEAWQMMLDWSASWLTAGKGILTFDIDGRRTSFDAIITEAEPKVQGLYFVVGYQFTLGKPCVR